jgi:hypothetical protein
MAIIQSISNDPRIIVRDTNGNMVIESGNSDNQKLIIDTTTELYTQRSVLKAIDTQFRYFTFPAAQTVPALNVNIETDFSDILPATDTIFARYAPSTSYNIPDSTVISGLEFSNVEVGYQLRTNQYYITKEIIDAGISLRFRVNVAVENRSTIPADLFVTVQRTKPNGLDRNFLPGTVTGNPASTFNIQDIPANTNNELFFDLVITPDQFERGTVFQIGGATNPGRDLRIIPALSYWVINDASQNVNEYNEPI